jgi:hypothetical protein
MVWFLKLSLNEFIGLILFLHIKLEAVNLLKSFEKRVFLKIVNFPSRYIWLNVTFYFSDNLFLYTNLNIIDNLIFLWIDC